MTVKNARTVMPLFVAMLLIPAGVNDAYAQTIPGEEVPDTTYEKADILRAFSVMEEHVTLDAERHLVINMTSVGMDNAVTPLDIQIIESYSRYNDEGMDVVGSVGVVNELGYDTDEQIRILIDDFENGEFRKLFSDNVSHTGTTLDVAYTTHTPVHHGSFGTWCGGAYHDPHQADPTPTTYSGGDSLPETQNHLVGLGYHMVPEYASWQGSVSQPYDFAVVVPSSDYSGLCDYGAFRDHAAILNNFSYRVQEEEPNPEVLSYIWPSPFWGFYVQWWHDNY